MEGCFLRVHEAGWAVVAVLMERQPARRPTLTEDKREAMVYGCGMRLVLLWGVTGEGGV